jgi:hypothetical protein
MIKGKTMTDCVVPGIKCNSKGTTKLYICTDYIYCVYYVNLLTHY